MNPNLRNRRNHSYARFNYGWDEARRELANGVHPEVVAARLGERIDYLLEVADQRGWPIRYQGASAEEVLAVHARRLGI